MWFVKQNVVIVINIHCDLRTNKLVNVSAVNED